MTELCPGCSHSTKRHLYINPPMYEVFECKDCICPLIGQSVGDYTT